MPGFEPLVGDSPRVLILGSMPSRVSLQKRQYYAHSQNAFWWIMSRICRFSTTLTYREKATQLLTRGFAVWDVLFDCERPGSADAAIIRASEQPNDFNVFLTQHASIELLAFNGRAAEHIFKRHFADLLSDHHSWSTRLLPSSSPAHASLSRQQKLNHWRKALLSDHG